MPYFIQKRGDGQCVVKGTKSNPGDLVMCHPTRKKALAHLRALYVHVEDALMKAIGAGQGVGGPRQGVGGVSQCVCPKCGEIIEHKRGVPCIERVCSKCSSKMMPLTDAVEKAVLQPTSLMSVYKDVITGSDRWITVSTAEMWDRQGEMFTKDAMDYDVARIQRTGEWPELRLFHVRGFKLGTCDSTQRIGNYMVDQGYWLDTPFAQAVKDLVVDNKGKWKVSRGFYSVEATGLCPECGASLMVHPMNYIVGVVCKECSAHYAKPMQLARLKHMKAITFDISITDVPVVTNTAVSAYGLTNTD